MANVFKPKLRGKRSTCWYGKLKTGPKEWKKVKLFSDKESSRRHLNKLQIDADRRLSGIRTHEMDSASLPVDQHIAQYISALRTEGRGNDHLRIAEWLLQQLKTRCAWSRIGDMIADSLRTLLIELAKANHAASYQNEYIKRAKAFANWLRREGRLTADPFVNVRRTNEKRGIKKRARRAMTDAQTVALLDSAPADRRLKYAFALFAGLRRSELADLRWGDLRLSAVPHPYIQLRQEQTKNGKADVLPLHPYLADLLTKLAPGQCNDCVVSSVPDMKTMAKDLVAAEIAAYTEDPAQGIAIKGGKRVNLSDASGRRIDFHSLRHTFATNLDRVGCSTTTRKALLRHADEGVTERYTHARVSELFEAIRRLSQPFPDSAQTTSHTLTETASIPLGVMASLLDHQLDQTLGGQGQTVAGIGKTSTLPEATCLTAQVRYTPALDAESRPLAAFGVEVLEIMAGHDFSWPSTQVD